MRERSRLRRNRAGHHDRGVGPDGADLFSGGSGPARDMMDYEQRTIGVSVLRDNKPDDGAPSEGDNVLSDVEFVTGGAGDDIFVGNGRPNVFNTYGGNDRISGRGGPDQLGGFGEGNKTISGGGGADLLLGEAGDDL